MSKKTRKRRRTRGAKPARAAKPATAAAPRTALANIPLPAWMPPLASWGPPTALLLLTALAYWPALFAGFVWDDGAFIVDDKQVGSWAGLWDIWFNPAAMAEFHYWPVLYSTFWLEHKLWGFNPLGFHAVNLVLHGANTVLLLHLLARLRVPGAWLIAAVFAAHPVHAEAVAWVIARKDLLATFFYLLAMDAWLRYREYFATSRRGRYATSNRRRSPAKAYLQLLALYAAGALSKSVALTLPAALLVHVWWREGRVTGLDLQQLAPLFLLGIAIAAFDLSLFTAQAVHEFEYSIAERIIIAAKALWFYAGKLLWPHPLLFMYPHWDVAPARWLNWLPVAAAVALAAGLWLARRRIGRGALAGALFFAITLSPVLGFADFGFMQFSFAADRYQYLPSAGLLTVLLGGAVLAYHKIAALTRRRFTGAAGDSASALDAWRLKPPAAMVARYAAGGLAASLLIICGALSFQRAQLFQDEVDIFRHVTATNPQAPSAWFNLGTVLMHDAPEEAAAAFEKALIAHPEDTQAYINLGSTLMRLERNEDALAVLRRAAPLQPEDFSAEKAPRRARYLASGVHYNTGNVLLALDRPAEAEQAFRRALAVDPGNADARASLIAALQLRAAEHFAAGRYTEALALYRRCVAIDPGSAESHSNLGSALGQMGRFHEAARSFERALAIDPQMESVRANLRAARERLKRK